MSDFKITDEEEEELMRQEEFLEEIQEVVAEAAEQAEASEAVVEEGDVGDVDAEEEVGGIVREEVTEMPTYSRMDLSEKRSLRQWTDWKNSATRYAKDFTPLPSKFQPENPEYPNSILMTGSNFYTIGAILLLSLCIYLSVLCCSSKPPPKKSEPQTNLYSFGAFLFGLAVVMIGGLCAVIGMQVYRNELWDTTSALAQTGSMLF